MEQSILTSTKKVLGVSADYTVWDEDILMYINTAFSILADLGLGPVDGFQVEDVDVTWDSYTVDISEQNLIRAYVLLKSRMLFDPPTTSYMITAMNDQIAQYEWRLNVMGDVTL